MVSVRGYHGMIAATHGIVQSNYSKIIKNGLVLWLDAMNDNSYPESGITWTDLSGNDINATLTNGPTFDTANGGSIVFDGIDDRAVVLNNVNLRMGTADYSIEAWVNFNTLPGVGAATTTAVLFRKNAGGQTECDLSIVSGSGGYRIAAAQATGSPPVITYTSSIASSISANNWYQFCITRQGTNISYYMTGSLVSTITNGLATVVTSSVTAASGSIASITNGNSRTTGKIATVRIYKNVALTATEVLQNFNATRTRFGI
jgi:hypothetical protein